MTMQDLLAKAGISAVRTVSEHTTVIEYAHGGARPATDTEKNLFGLLATMADDR